MCVEDEWFENKNQDDGAGPDTETDEVGVCVGGRALHNEMVMVIVRVGHRWGGGDGDDDTMEDDEDEDEVLEENDDWGQEEEEEDKEE